VEKGPISTSVKATKNDAIPALTKFHFLKLRYIRTTMIVLIISHVLDIPLDDALIVMAL